jgi:hypothetical protein
MVMPPTWIEPVSMKVVLGVTVPVSSAAAMVRIFVTEPGSYAMPMERLYWLPLS